MKTQNKSTLTAVALLCITQGAWAQTGQTSGAIPANSAYNGTQPITNNSKPTMSVGVDMVPLTTSMTDVEAVNDRQNSDLTDLEIKLQAINDANRAAVVEMARVNGERDTARAGFNAAYNSMRSMSSEINTYNAITIAKNALYNTTLAEIQPKLTEAARLDALTAGLYAQRLCSAVVTAPVACLFNVYQCNSAEGIEYGDSPCYGSYSILATSTPIDCASPTCQTVYQNASCAPAPDVCTPATKTTTCADAVNYGNHAGNSTGTANLSYTSCTLTGPKNFAYTGGCTAPPAAPTETCVGAAYEFCFIESGNFLSVTKWAGSRTTMQRWSIEYYGDGNAQQIPRNDSLPITFNKNQFGFFAVSQTEDPSLTNNFYSPPYIPYGTSNAYWTLNVNATTVMIESYIPAHGGQRGSGIQPQSSWTTFDKATKSLLSSGSGFQVYNGQLYLLMNPINF